MFFNNSNYIIIFKANTFFNLPFAGNVFGTPFALLAYPHIQNLEFISLSILLTTLYLKKMCIINHAN